MSKLSKSLARNASQKLEYINNLHEDPTNKVATDMLNWLELSNNHKNELENDIQWQENNLEYDLRSTDWILEKARTRDGYAQNIYAALCNMNWQKLDVLPILKNELCSYSWRYAGGIVADMREEGDYIDWYCSGIGSGLGNGDKTGTKGYVSEGIVTDEIKEDFKKIGWIPVECSDDDLF